MEASARSGLEEYLGLETGELQNNNRRGDDGVELYGDEDYKTRPDSISDDYVHEHKHLSGENQVVYLTEQMRTQRAQARATGRTHIVSISSDNADLANGTPRPSGPMAKNSDIYYVDPASGKVTHRWVKRDGSGYWEAE